VTFGTVLVANRGEIARRIMRTCRERGIATVAVHSAIDADALHVADADEAVALPGDPVAAYLDIDAIVAAARRTRADAIHPGYGFLSEHPGMPAACDRAGITFVGPDSDVIALMGDKAASKAAAADAGVPVLRAVDPARLDADELHRAVADLGLPVMVKAVAGGGGKGMRRVDHLDDLEAAIAAAGREAMSGFGDDRLLIERFVTGPRHVEVQVAGDVHGGAVHLFERDCSVQRRHQKIVEEAPSPALDADLRARMGAAAVALVTQVGYTNLGTVEFLLDTSGDGEDFFFLEMNTRLQVEHPVTEAVTGLDLVGCQLDIAAGGHVPTPPERPRGHAIEVRLYAEDVAAGFLPQAGTVADFAVPGTVRVDTGVGPDSSVSAHYDPMLAKVIAAGPDREAARTRLLAALDDTVVTGLVTNLDHLRAILAHEAFVDGGFTTGFLATHLPDWAPVPPDAVTVAAAMATMADPAASADGRRAPRQPGHDRADARGTDPRQADPWHASGPWRGGGAGGWSLTWPRVGTARITTTPAGWEVAIGDSVHAVVDRGRDEHRHHLLVDGEEIAITAWRDGDHVWVARSGAGSQRVAVPDPVGHRDTALVTGDAALVAPMPGQVTSVEVAVGDEVAAGRTLVVVEAMKMEHPVTAPGAGVVADVKVVAGQAVSADEVVVVLHADDSTSTSPTPTIDDEAGATP
jgi:acetyl/propionyl-CoA carboxylase alpha subunit